MDKFPDDLDDDLGGDLETADSLCIGVCTPDAEGGHCIGCGRVWDERTRDDLDFPDAAPGSDDAASSTRPA